MNLTAIVIGTGWAGEGHVLGLRSAGVNVVALCGRSKEATDRKTEDLGVDNPRYDWEKVIEEFKPDIVSIATTVPPHRNIAETASALGCNVICEKPLAQNGKEARAMLEAVKKSGVKHGYAASGCYKPKYAFMKSLIEGGVIGTLKEFEDVFFSSLNFQSLAYSWIHNTAEGGGALNNKFPHDLESVARMIGGRVIEAGGYARRMMDKIPVVKRYHDIRELVSSRPLSEEELAKAEWRAADTDHGYTVNVKYQLGDGSTVDALFYLGMGSRPIQNYEAIVGEKGTLYIEGDSTEIKHLDKASGEWKGLAIPGEIEGGSVQELWNIFFKEFVSDLIGKGNRNYPTFHDGLVACEVMDIVRRSDSMTSIPTDA